MKNILNINSTTQFHISNVIALVSVLFILGCTCYWLWKMKGVTLYMGFLIIIMGLFIIYMGFTDSTLNN